MITNVQPDFFSFLVAAIAQPQLAMNEDEIKILREELTSDPENRGYADKPAEVVHMLLHGEYSQLIPECWEVKNLVNGAELKNWIAPLATRLLMDTTVSVQIASKWRAIMDTWSKVADSYVFDPSITNDSDGNQSTWHLLVSMAPELVNGSGERIITEDRIRSLTHKLISASIVMRRPRIEQLLGSGVVLSMEDLSQVM